MHEKEMELISLDEQVQSLGLKVASLTQSSEEKDETIAHLHESLQKVQRQGAELRRRRCDYCGSSVVACSVIVTL